MFLLQLQDNSEIREDCFFRTWSRHIKPRALIIKHYLNLIIPRGIFLPPGPSTGKIHHTGTCSVQLSKRRVYPSLQLWVFASPWNIDWTWAPAHGPDSLNQSPEVAPQFTAHVLLCQRLFQIQIAGVILMSESKEILFVCFKTPDSELHLKVGCILHPDNIDVHVLWMDVKSYISAF